MADYSEQAKLIIATAIENAIKHITGKPEVIHEDTKIGEYWPLGSQADEQTGLSAIETFIKARDMHYLLFYLPGFACRSGIEEVNGNISSNI